MLRDLGIRIASPAGSLSIIRGAELSHSITEWSGKSRFCVVHTTHDAVMRYAYRILGRPQPLFKGKEKASHCIDPGDDDDEDELMDMEANLPLESYHPRGPKGIEDSDEDSDEESSEDDFF